MADLGLDIVTIEIETPLPSEGIIGTTYQIEGTVKIEAIGAPPFVYAEVIKKEWYRPEVIEETEYKRGFPMPISGKFSIKWQPKKAGIYEVAVVATPAPLSLPVINVQPVLGRSDSMSITISEKPAGEYRELQITAYDSLSPPAVLQVGPGGTITVVSEFDYIGPAVKARIYSALWHPSFLNPHDEIAHGEQEVSIADSPSPGRNIRGEVKIVVPVGFAGTNFGLYTKLIGPDVFSPYYGNVITIVGAPPEKADIADFDFKATKGTYNLGAEVPFTADYKYKGVEQEGQLTIALGTGVTFSEKYKYEPIPVHFEAATDWAPSGIEGTIKLPQTLELGQTYSVRAKLETADGVQETDTDWTVITITKAPPTSDIGPLDKFAVERGIYNLGDKVGWTLPFEYKGKSQGGWLTFSLGTGAVGAFFTVYTYPRIAVTFAEAMDWTPFELSGNITLPTLERGKTYSVRAKLETADGVQETGTEYGALIIEKALEAQRLEVTIDPTGAGTVKTDITPVGGTTNSWLFPYGSTVYVTAVPKTGYTFESWSGEIVGGTVYTETAEVKTMTEHRGVTAHFKKVVVPPPEEMPVPSEFQGVADAKYLDIVNPFGKSTWPGGSIFLTVMFRYRGLAITKKVYAAIGKSNWGFDEKVHGSKEINIAGSTTFATRTGLCEIIIPANMALGTYDLYAKIIDGMIFISKYYINAVTILPRGDEGKSLVRFVYE